MARRDRDAAERAVADFLRALGHAPVGELASTPALVAAAWLDDLLTGEDLDPSQLLRAARVASTSRGHVVLRDIAVTLICPHHLLPAQGWGDVVLLPGEHIAGLGAIARALGACTRRLTLQEDAGARMARALVDGLGAEAALCRLRLTHTCLSSRGAREGAATVETVSSAGSFAEGGEACALALVVLGESQRAAPDDPTPSAGGDGRRE